MRRIAGGCGDRYEAKVGLTPYKEEIFAMDTFMSISAYGDNSSKAVETAGAEIQRLDELLSVSEKSGDVYQLNQKRQKQADAISGATLSSDAVKYVVIDTLRSKSVREVTGEILPPTFQSTRQVAVSQRRKALHHPKILFSKGYVLKQPICVMLRR